MKKLTKHLAAIAMALAVAVTSLVPVTVEAKPNYNEKVTVYRSSADTSASYASIYVGGLSKSDTIKKSSVKSSNTKSVKIYSLQKTHSLNEYETQYFSPSSTSKSRGESYYYYIGLYLYKPGKSTVSFKIGNKSYKSVVTVVKYENPLKSAKILGKDYAGKLNKQNSYNGIKAKSTQKNQTFTFEANKNWKISYVSVYKHESSYKNNYSSSLSYSQSWSYYNSPKKKATCKVGDIEKGKYYSIYLSMTNTKTGNSMGVYYYINSSNY